MAAGDRIFMAKESTSQKILANTEKIISGAAEKPKRYGMRINRLDSNPATRVTYLFDAVGMTPAGMNYSAGAFDYGDWGDLWFVKNNRPVMLRTDGTVDYELNHENHALKLDGTPSAVASTAYGGNAMSLVLGFEQPCDERGRGHRGEPFLQTACCCVSSRGRNGGGFPIRKGRFGGFTLRVSRH